MASGDQKKEGKEREKERKEEENKEEERVKSGTRETNVIGKWERTNEEKIRQSDEWNFKNSRKIEWI